MGLTTGSSADAKITPRTLLSVLIVRNHLGVFLLLFNVVHQLANSLKTGIVSHGDAEFVFDVHDDLHHVQGIQTDFFKGGVGSDFTVVRSVVLQNFLDFFQYNSISPLN